MSADTALLVIDMQRGFLSAESSCCISGAEATVPACTKLIKGCREKGIPVFFVTRRYRENRSDVEHTRFPGWLSGSKPLSPGCPDNISGDMPAEFCPGDRDYFIRKPRFSAFFGTELDLILRRLGIKNLLLTGTTTPNCIRTTCYDAISMEYNVAVISDCTSSASEEIQLSNLRDMENVGAEVMSSDDYLRGRRGFQDTASQARKYAREY